MTAQKSGVIVTITASPSRSSVPLMGGTAPAWVADVAAFVASDRAGAITGAITNLTGGLVVG